MIVRLLWWDDLVHLGGKGHVHAPVGAVPVLLALMRVGQVGEGREESHVVGGVDLLPMFGGGTARPAPRTASDSMPMASRRISVSV